VTLEAVLDTNVLVSGLLCANSLPGEILDLVFGNDITPVFDDRILYEYRDVLYRPKFSFSKDTVEDFLSAFETIGRLAIVAHTHIRLPDEKDRCFYECALATTSQILVTGNSKHFPSKQCMEIKVYTPKEFMLLVGQG
jgi:putative PIN family toxin of toxin-antitoxin system